MSEKKFQGKQICTSAKVNQLTVQANKDKISFTAMSLSGEENEVITDLVKQESDVFVDIEVEGTDFPKIRVQGKLKGYKISKTCDAPELINIQFSSDQVHQLANLIRSSEDIQLTFLECEPKLELPEGQDQF